jgi:formiminoglutamase
LSRFSTYDSIHEVELLAVPVFDRGDSHAPPVLDHPLTILLGGHNAVTYHALRSVADLRSWGLLTVDAHHDVRPYKPGVVGNGSPVRALIDGGLPGAHVVQVGITGFSNSLSHRRWCEDNAVTVVGLEGLDQIDQYLAQLAARCDSVYVDLDVDVLDRAFAPGSPGARPGGTTPRKLQEAAFCAGAAMAVRAIDIVEVDPTADHMSATVDNAALALLNAAAGYSRRISVARNR